jgi:hypothetical protein
VGRPGIATVRRQHISHPGQTRRHSSESGQAAGTALTWRWNARSGLPAPELYRLTGGTPFYLTEVLRAGMEEIPPSARDAVLARAAQLSAQAAGRNIRQRLTGGDK